MKLLLGVFFYFIFFFAGNAQTKIVCPAPALSNKSTDPLLIIDSVIVDYANIRFLSPQSIDQFKVLKGVEVTAIYGSRAAYGVLAVGTKKGFRFLGIGEILGVHKADSVIGKPMIVTVNSDIVSDIKALKIDASMIRSVHISKMVNSNAPSSYNVTILLSPTRPASLNSDQEDRKQMMVKGGDTSN